MSDEPKLLFHEYETPPVAVTLIAVVVQFKIVEPVLLVIPAVGVVTSLVTVILDVVVQPFAHGTITV